MPLIAPVLDDRTFEDLRKELVDRIPVYNPEWTDHNRSDPAITLLELFAYLGEGLQFRFNQIPEATQLAFLRLLDLRLEPARPATALVRALVKPAVTGGVQVYGGDQVKAGKIVFTVEKDTQLWPLDCVAVAREPVPMPDEKKEPVLFATVQGTIDAVAAEKADLAAIATYKNRLLEADGSTEAVDFTDTIDGSVWIAVLREPTLPLAPTPGSTVSITLGFSPDPRTPELDDITACRLEDQPRAAALEWRASLSKPAGDDPPRYVALRVASDTTAGFTGEGVVRLELPVQLDTLGVPKAKPELAGTGELPPVLDDIRAEKVWFWIRVWRSDQSRIGPVRLICLNALECVQAVSATAEFLGTGSGQPGQVFELANRPVLLDPTHKVGLQVQGVDWTQKDDLDASKSTDQHFTVDPEAGAIMFGERFPQVGEPVRVTSYRYGGGAAGNVPAKSINKFGDLRSVSPSSASTLLRPDAVSVELANPFKAKGGCDSETIEHGLGRIPGDLRRRTRAVTRGDFAELALMTPGVTLGRAECLPLFHAPDRTSPRAGVVSVMVWPTRDPRHPNAPMPDAYELQAVCRWLDTKRLVTTELYVIPPTYHGIAVSLAVKIKDGYGLDAVRNWVELVLRQYLGPLPPYGPDGQGWPLGRRVLDRELEGVAMQVDGVEYVQSLRLAGFENGAWQETAVVELAQWEVPEIRAVTIVDDSTPPPAPGSDVPPPPSGKPVPIPVLREIC